MSQITVTITSDSTEHPLVLARKIREARAALAEVAGGSVVYLQATGTDRD